MTACIALGSWAQAPAGSLAGKLTDLHSRPLEGVTVFVRNRNTGLETRTTTARGGSFRFASLDPGEYTLEAQSSMLGEGSLRGILVVSGHEARILAAVALSPITLAKADPFRQSPAATHGAGNGAPATFTQINPSSQISVPVAVSPALAGTGVLPPAKFVPAPPTEIRHDIVALTGGSAIAELPQEALVKLPSTPFVVGSSTSIGSAVMEATLIRAVGLAAQTAIGLGSANSNLQRPDEASAQDHISMQSAEVDMLPLANRDWKSVVSPSLAVLPENVNGRTLAYTAQPPSEITVDGASTRLAFGGRSFGRSASSESLLGPGATDTVLRAVQFASGDEATLLRGMGTRSEVITRRGADGFHGRASFFTRQDLWGAQNPFTQWTRQSGPATSTTIPIFEALPYTPEDRSISWSFGAGAGIHRRFYWFAALDGSDRDDPGVSTVKHPDDFFAQPSNDQMQVLSARLGLNSADPISAGLLAYTPMLQTLDGLLGPAPRSSTQITGFGRTDWSFTPRSTFTLEGTNTVLDAPGSGLPGISEPYGSHSFGSSDLNEQWGLARWQQSLSTHLLAVTLGSFGRHDVRYPAETPSPYEQTLNINSWGRLPQIVVDSRYGFTIGNPARFGPGSYPDEHLYQGQEQIAWTRQSFEVKAGLDLRQNTDSTTLLRDETGTYDYSSVQNFASDALSFAAFGLNGQLNPLDQHNCDQTGKSWRDSSGTLHGLGYLPCYSWYKQTLGPANWWLRTTEWAGYVSARWHGPKQLLFSAGLRWERQQTPPPIGLLNNPALPLTQKLPSLGNEWEPRMGFAWGKPDSRWPVFHLGYGMYFGRTPNATLETALTQTGSPKGDLNFFLRPTDNLLSGGAPPFPYALAGEPGTDRKPGVVEMSASFRNGEAHQAVASIDETLPGHLHVDISGVASLTRRLPVASDDNLDLSVNPQTITYAIIDGNGSGPLKMPRITVPFFASWPSSNSQPGSAGRINPNYQQILLLESRANATYEAAVVRITRNSYRGLTFRAHYTFAHAADWNPNESTSVAAPSIFDPTNFREEYGASDLDVRQSASASLSYEPRWTTRDLAGRLANGWLVSSLGNFQSGLPYSMRTSGTLAKEFGASGEAIVALASGINGYGGDNRIYGVGRNTYRYPPAWKADLRIARHFNLGEMRKLELLAESFNLLNHRNVTELETVGYTIEAGTPSGGLPSLNFLTGLKSGQTEFGQPLNINATDFYRQRQFQFGVRFSF
ncbi:MAG TPA: carboxypeptidase-like regulatory domain-containing protein [Terracidiphilus sp.]|nr:carboxypeptidase-like regulatory domain-containing protein [Terracidiphilus sp.]